MSNQQVNIINQPPQDWRQNRKKVGIVRTILAGIASMMSGGATHPIDTVKVRLQKEGELGLEKVPKKYINIVNGFRVMIREEGVRSLYKGLSMSLGREGTYSALRLGLYEPYRELLGGHDPKTTPIWKKFLAGFMSGTTGAIIATPYDLLKVRLQSNQQKGNKKVSLEVKEIMKKAGVRGLFKGIVPNLTRGAILTATKMATYDQSKRIVMRIFNLKDGLVVYLSCSFITGFVLSVTTSPIDVIKTRIMSQSYDKTVYTGLVDCAVKTYKAEGLFGFYKGFIPQWCRFGPFNIIQLVAWEQLRKLCGIKTV